MKVIDLLFLWCARLACTLTACYGVYAMFDNHNWIPVVIIMTLACCIVWRRDKTTPMARAAFRH